MGKLPTSHISTLSPEPLNSAQNCRSILGLRISAPTTTHTSQMSVMIEAKKPMAANTTVMVLGPLLSTLLFYMAHRVWYTIPSYLARSLKP